MWRKIIYSHTINIVNNSKDVLLEQQRTDGWIKVHLTTLDNSALLTIEDNGGGISDDVVPHIFDEYFTTKNSDNGTGLGLYMSYRIITESLHGQIYAKISENGAKFFILLPLRWIKINYWILDNIYPYILINHLA